MPRREVPKVSTSGSRVESLRGARPWGDFVKKYFMAGWCPLPLPPRKKSSPPTGTTGRFEMPNKKMVQTWAKDRDPRCNIAIRVPDNVIGIDVDAYDAKVGRASLGELIEQFGELPKTWTLTSRSDGVSGIRFYRVPLGMHWPGEALPDVQIVQHHHRYAVAYPSVHPDTRGIYLWYGPEDALDGHPRSVSIEHEIPSIDDLAELPASWVSGLTSGRLWAELPSDLGATRADIMEWIGERPGGSECRLMRKQADAAIEEIGIGGAHDALNSRVYSLVSLASEGHSGLETALGRVRTAFTAEVTRPGRKGRRGRREVGSEFLRVRDGAIRIMMASVGDGESRLEEDCACAGGSIEWGEKLGVEVEEDPSGGGSRARKLGKAKPADKYTFDDSGNAEHMLDILDGSAYWVAGEKAWFFWNSALGTWQPDPSGARAVNAAQLVGKRCRELSDEYMDKLRAAGSSVTLDSGGDLGSKVKQLDAHANKSSGRRGLEDMVKIASAQIRAERRAEDFDFRRDLIACPNGTLELGSSGVSFRPAERADYLSVSTCTPYVPGAQCWAWDAYLERFIPDLSVRRYVQKIAGYSLYGENPERKMFFLQGGTSTGKSTFGKALSSALGQHAGAMNLSLFRDSQDEKPRPDLVRALAKRVLVAYESSQEWHLHGDQIKRLTGADPIKARLLHSSVYVDRVPAFTPWVVSNSMPQVHGADQALARRLVRVPFRETVAEGAEDFRITAALESEEGRSAVLAWAVRGWELYREDGGLVAPEAVVAATAEMLEELTDIDVYLRDCTESDEKGRIVFSELFDHFMQWADTNNVDAKRMSSNKFGRELTGRGYGILATRIKGESVKVRTGLRWRK